MIKIQILLIFIYAYIAPSSIWAKCPAPNFTTAENVYLSRDTALIVTHASYRFDDLGMSKQGINKVISWAKSNNHSVIYLHGKEPIETYYYRDCDPDYYVFSSIGQFKFAFQSKHIVSVGGFWEGCQRRSVEDILATWTVNNVGEDLSLTLPLSAIYTTGIRFTLTGDKDWEAATHKLQNRYGVFDLKTYFNSLNAETRIKLMEKYSVVFKNFSTHQVNFYLGNILMHQMRIGSNLPLLKVRFI